MSADVDVSSQAVLAAHDNDRQIAPWKASKVVAHLSNLGDPTHVLPVVSEDTLAF